MYIGIHDQNNHCVEDVFLTYLMYTGLPYCYMYADSWKMYCTGDGFEFGSNEFSAVYPHKEAMENVLRVKKTDIGQVSLSDLRDLIYREYFVGIHYDAFHCEWSIAFHKYHLQHYFIVSDIEDEYLVVSDPYLHEFKVNLSYKDIVENNGQFFLLEEGNITTGSQEVVDEILKINDDMFLSIKRLGDFISQNDISEYGKQHRKDITSCKLYQNITYVVNSRYNLAKLMFFISEREKSFELEDIAVSFVQIAQKWETVKSQIIKMMLSKAFYEKGKEGLRNEIYEISNQEEKLYSVLKCYRGGKE